MMNFEISRVYRDIIEEVSRSIEEDTENIGLSREQIQDLKICWGRRLREMTTPKDHPSNFQFRTLQDSYRNSKNSSIYGFRGDSLLKNQSFDNRSQSFDGRKSIAELSYQNNGSRHVNENYSYDERNGRLSYYRGMQEKNNDRFGALENLKNKENASLNENDSLDSSDELLSDSDNGSDMLMEEANPNYMMCLYVKVDKNKFKWRVKLKQGFLNIGQSEFVFDSAHGDLTWC